MNQGLEVLCLQGQEQEEPEWDDEVDLRLERGGKSQ